MDDTSEDSFYLRLRTTVPAKWASNGAIKSAKFSVFGSPRVGSKRLLRVPVQELCPRRAASPNKDGVWYDPEAPPTTIDVRPFRGVSSIQPNELFLVGNSPFGDVRASITSMRKVSYFTPAGGRGYQWAIGIAPRSAGHRVQTRFETDGNALTPGLPALEEITCYTDKRSMPPPVAYCDADLSAFNLRRSFPLGFLFKIAVRVPAANTIRSWHGSNLYSAHSIFVSGLLANRPDNGPVGIYSFGDDRIKKTSSYCDYVLSGSGRAWSVIIETGIPKSYETVSKIQRCTQAQSTTVVAIWIHGLDHGDFSHERIWPRWCPEVEFSSVWTRI